MKLTPEQIRSFDEQGYVFFPNCFSEDEVAVLRSEADRGKDEGDDEAACESHQWSTIA